MRTAAITGLIATTLVAAGCGDGNKDKPTRGKSTRTVKVSLTDAGCDPSRLNLPSGPTTFEVTNAGTAHVSELEVLAGTSILGEIENVTPGLHRTFSVTLQPGDYKLYCPGGKGATEGVLHVTGNAVAKPTSATHKAAVTTYRRYLEQQTAELVGRTRAFTLAVTRGNVAAAKRLYGPARVPYERVEPVAESFGSLDPRIDARAGDVPRSKWTGFHPLEQALWVRRTTKGQEKLASRLLDDVRELQTRVLTVKLEPAQIANGAVELLGEVSKSKVTGEEERYSHIDLVDFQANVDGAKAAYGAVAAIVRERDKALDAQIQRRFAAVDSALDAHRRGDGFVTYGALSRADVRQLSQSIDALAEPLSQVPALIVK